MRLTKIDAKQSTVLVICIISIISEHTACSGQSPARSLSPGTH